MQLLLILALLLYGGKGNAQNLISEYRPILETFGGEEIKQALKSAEELSSVISAVQGLTSTPPESSASADAAEQTDNAENPAIAFPLSPISAIADRDITYSLSKYISSN